AHKSGHHRKSNEFSCPSCQTELRLAHKNLRTIWDAIGFSAARTLFVHRSYEGDLAKTVKMESLLAGLAIYVYHRMNETLERL
ncbi:MAG: hypothetical protein AAFV59_14215, partial [Pseudomonadota bacterium]